MVVEVADHMSIVHLNDAVGKWINAAVVCDNDDAPVGFQCAGFEEFERLVSAHGVERGGGLVADDQARLVDKRAGNRHALLLAAGELVRVGFEFFTKPDLLENNPRPLLRLGS